MAPKKLTDCPENLRESIDWLIQVRYGGDNKGLGDLAKALKTFINEAITEATKSLVHEHNKLECPFQYSATETNCQHYETQLEDRKKEFQDSGNPQGFLKDAEVKRLEGTIADCKSKYHNERYRDPSKQKTLRDIEDRQKKLEELIEQLEKFIGKDGNPGECSTLLTNLCSCLEKFLGFNPETKGYNGKGIVYADLDRLCDAVMAFLYGVLDSVKDENEVITYDINDDPNKLIKNLPNTIKRYIYSGTDGFTKAISAVTEALQAWNSELVRRSNKVVEDSSTGVLHALKTKIDENVKTIEEMSTDDKFNRVVGEWYTTVTKGLPEAIKSVGSAINDLDEPLRNAVTYDFEEIKTKVETMSDSTIRDVKQLKELSENVSDGLRELERSVKGKVEQRVVAYRDLFKKDFAIINSEINTISAKVKEHVDALNVWIEVVQDLVDKAIPQIQIILNEIENDGSKGKRHPKEIISNATSMQTKADALRLAVEDAKVALEPLVGTIKQKVKDLEEVYKNTFKALRQAVESQVGAAQAVLQQLGIKVGDDLEGTVKNHIKVEIEKVIKAFQAGANKAKEFTATGTVQFIQEFWIGVDETNDAKTLAAWAEQAKNGGNSFNSAVYKLSGGGQSFTELKAVLDGLESFRDTSENNFYAAIIADVDSKLGAALKEIKRNLSGKMPTYYTHANKDNGAIHIAIKEVQTKVDEYFQGKDSNELSEKKLELHGYKEGDKNKKVLLTDEIEKIQHKGLAKFDPFESGKKDAIEKETFSILLENVTSNLTQLIDAIKNNAGESSGVLTKLNQLNNNIGKTTTGGLSVGLTISLQQTHKALIELHDSKLRALIDKATKFLKTTIPTETTKCISDINVEVNKLVTQTIRDIKKDALDRYVTSRSDQLRELKKFVEQQRLAIEKIIKRDSINGVKGFLKTIKGVKVTMNFDASHHFDDSKNLLNPMTTLTGSDDSKKFSGLSKKFDDYSDNMLHYTGDYIRKAFRIPPRTPTENVNHNKFKLIFEHLRTLMEHLGKNDRIFHFDNVFEENLKALSSAVGDLSPHQFGDASCPILDAIKAGLHNFTGQLDRTYINKYSGSKINWDSGKNHDKGKCARACLTSIHMLFHGLYKLFYKCTKQWRGYTIKGSVLDETYDLRDFLVKSGYGVEQLDKSKTGMKIAIKLRDGFRKNNEFNKEPDANYMTFNTYIHSVKNSNDSNTILLKLFTHLVLYLRICHLLVPSSAKYPCSAFEMLAWLSGLKYNVFYQKLLDQCYLLIKSEKDTLIRNMLFDVAAVHLPAISTPTYDLLVGVAGYGNANTYYGCDYLSNSLGLFYPSNVANCFDMLVDLLRRLCPVLTFLRMQCGLDKWCFGWRDCIFGNGVQSSGLQCDLHADEFRSISHECSLTSPLHLYLTDSLRSMLPHQVTSINSKLICGTCSKTSVGMPCLTPLGFRSFSGPTKTGSDIRSMIDEICEDGCSFMELYSLLSCLVNRPPQMLPDIFSFYFKLTQYWGEMGQASTKNEPIQCAISNVIEQTVACDIGNAKKLLDPCRLLYESSLHSTHDMANEPDLKYLLGCGKNSCGYYLQPLNLKAYTTFAPKHAEKYLSWLLYISGNIVTFLDLLIESLTSISCHDHECSGCNDAENCNPNTHGKKACGCKSVVHCQGIMPTLYKFGFTFGNVKRLMNSKSCQDMVSQIDQVKTSQLMEAWLKAIDEFFLQIRKPFMITLTALWLLSLLYLLHIMVIRLDLLHIKSHLHSPSSHRIAAQSLLAAARVGRLAKITYLQP